MVRRKQDPEDSFLRQHGRDELKVRHQCLPPRDRRASATYALDRCPPPGSPTDRPARGQAERGSCRRRLDRRTLDAPGAGGYSILRFEQDGECVQGKYDVKGTGGAFSDVYVSGTVTQNRPSPGTAEGTVGIEATVTGDRMEGRLVAQDNVPQQLRAAPDELEGNRGYEVRWRFRSESTTAREGLR